jgi:hypothetical protein
MSPRSRTPGSPCDGVGQRGHLLRRRPAAPAQLTLEAPEVDLEQDVDLPPAPLPRTAQDLGQGHPVDRVHHRAEPGDGGRLVALQLADEVPPDGRRVDVELGGLAQQLLRPVLAEVVLPQPGEDAHVGDRPGLAHREQGHRPGVPPGRAGGVGDARPHRAQVLLEAGHVLILPRRWWAGTASLAVSRARRSRPAGR